LKMDKLHNEMQQARQQAALRLLREAQVALERVRGRRK
jgi:hypothetical protein